MRVVRMYTSPWCTAASCTHASAAVPSAGYSTTLSGSARKSARSSSPLWLGPSSPLLTPTCDPQSLTLQREMAAMRSWSAARVKKHAKDDAKGTKRWAARPVAMPTMFCSAMYASTNRSGWASRKRSAYVEFFTSPSSARTRGSAAPSRASASP